MFRGVRKFFRDMWRCIEDSACPKRNVIHRPYCTAPTVSSGSFSSDGNEQRETDNCSSISVITRYPTAEEEAVANYLENSSELGDGGAHPPYVLEQSAGTDGGAAPTHPLDQQGLEPNSFASKEKPNTIAKISGTSPFDNAQVQDCSYVGSLSRTSSGNLSRNI